MSKNISNQSLRYDIDLDPDNIMLPIIEESVLKRSALKNKQSKNIRQLIIERDSDIHYKNDDRLRFS